MSVGNRERNVKRSVQWRRTRAYRYVPPVLGRVLAIIALLALNGFFVAAEFSIVRSRRSRLEAMARGGDNKARLVLKATTSLARLLSASQFGITLASIGIGALAEEALSAVFAHFFIAIPLPLKIGAAGLGTVCALSVVTYLHVVFGELAPRGATINNPERVARWLVPGLVAFAWITKPFTWMLNRSAELVLKPFGLKPGSAEENVHSADELRILVEQSQKWACSSGRTPRSSRGYSSFPRRMPAR